MCGRPRRRSGHRLTLERGLTRAAASTASTEAAEQSAGAPAGRPPRSDLSDVAVVIVDHGSRRQASNEMLEQFGEVFQLCSDHKIVEIAHMEIAEPSIMQAVEKCVARGATEVVIAPYFLSRGRHIQTDIPALVEEAKEAFPGIKCTVADPIGIDQMVVKIIQARVAAAVEQQGPE
eukprot:jgi/Tetstr1/422444/TSEL_013282.t1